MRVICPDCGSKAIIGKTNRLSPAHADLYCSCTEPECGHTFVANLSFSHTLSPSARTSSALVTELARAMDPTQRKQLQQELALL
ncbi:ogr/Delta-like zinc finger family protein [Shewanella sp.]|uniref:ogr/Delta-like zinc finger family protein n=1 Tax=Shewanella sp. TaxID=50422 RepID=UPI001EB40349|nr:ogr/Delta-like zinc finger family protein [Shewanella sp.]NRB24052.1 ogr/Delta-like zinc finger family protein [Shewanella sp.]